LEPELWLLAVGSNGGEVMFWTIVAAAGIPSALTGFFFWLLKRYIDKRDRERDQREKNIEKLMMMLVNTSRANNRLANATARAVQRIPDAKCNGDMTQALAEADKYLQEEKKFLMEQGINHIFGE
jgi:hypothetical protein